MKHNNYLLCFSSSLFFSHLAVSIPARAQISADDSLPAPTEVIEQSDRLIEIMGGTEAGINLFHSFTEFSVEEGNIARFMNNNTDLQNVIGRITGTSISEIFGRIEAGGMAPNFNLFLLNPNGIIFGSDASLNINGSFVATTADAIQFDDRGFFGASDPNDPSLLTIQPSAFFFNQMGANPIYNQSRYQETEAEEPVAVGLQVPSDKSLLLIGGDITLDGGIINAPNGRVELGGLSEKGTVVLNMENNGLSLGFPDLVARSDVLLTNEAKIEVRDRGSGSVAINARNIEIAELSQIASGILADLEFDGNQTGKITLQATEEVIVNGSFVGSNVRQGAIGNSGDVMIIAESLDLIDGGTIYNITEGKGDTGDISLNIGNSLTIRGKNSTETAGSNILNQIRRNGEGSGGDLKIAAKSLFVTDGASIQATTEGRGNAGNIIIRVGESIIMENTPIDRPVTQIRTTVEPGAIGNGGTIDVRSRSLRLTGGSQFLASVFRADNDEGLPGGQGIGGEIVINVADSVDISGVQISGFSSGIFANTGVGAEGDAGNVTVNTNSLRIADGAVINTETENFGSGGNISINANTFEALRGGQIISQASSSGNAGNIIVNATESVTLFGSDPTFDERSARFGTIVSNIGAKSGFFVNSESTGQAGNITVNTPQLIIDEGKIDAETAQTSGETGANINIKTDLLTLQNESQISATASGSANGGNVNIDAEFIIAFPDRNNDIIAAAARGEGGEINIIASGIFGITERSSTPPNNTNDLDASSQLGLDGTVSINELEVNPAEALEDLPVEVIDVARLVAQNLCQQGRGSEFVVTGKGGIAPSPSETRDSNIGEVGLVEPVEVEEAGRAGEAGEGRSKEVNEIVEAQGWVVNDRGTLELVAHQTNNSNFSPQLQQKQLCP